ncbi:MAG: metallophosphoesterase [Planctomycetota bacterium]
MKRITFLLILACSIFTGCVTEKQKQHVHFPIKIGLLADTQLTSHNGFSNYSQRSKFADRMVDVAIRPPALECFLSEEMLNIALKKLTQDVGGEKDGVDVIIYLGDGVNSGGTDEIELFFSVLEKHRGVTGIPIFVLIGNHDYLGCGNIVTPGTRFALLNRDGRPSNPALSKYQVLKKISEFNHASNNLPTNKKFKYIDNYKTVERYKELDHNTGLYLSGLLSYSEEGKNSVEVFLLDSSDYKDAPDWSSLAKWGFYGVIGSLSFKDEPGVLSQTSYFKNVAGSSAPDFRFLASHYPKDHLDRITFAKPGEVPLDVTNIAWEVTESAFSYPTFSERLNQNLEDLLSHKKRNYWLSGHTHVPTTPQPSKIVVGGLLQDKYYRGINTGSTTDYRAHVVIVESYERQKNDRVDDFIGYREIPLFGYREDLLVEILKEIGKYGRDHYSDPNFKNVITSMNEWIKEEQSLDLIDASFSILRQRPGNLLDKGVSTLGLGPKDAMGQEERYWFDMGATILGLNKKYRKDGWIDKQTEASVRHLKKFVKLFVDRTGNNRDDVISCLAFLAGAYECGKLPRGCDFSLSYLKKLCDNPM